jgi:hypothetical protein
MARLPALKTINVRKPPDLPWPGRAMRCAAEFRSYQAPFCVADCFAQGSIRNAGVVRKPRERFGLERPH